MREFWIIKSTHHNGKYHTFIKSSELEKQVTKWTKDGHKEAARYHVIERSAYDELKKQADALSEALEIINICGVSVLAGYRARAEKALADYKKFTGEGEG